MSDILFNSLQVYSCPPDLEPTSLWHDSVILGAFKNEIPPGKKIAQAIFMGPKNYCMDIADEKTGQLVERITKIRGFSLKSEHLTEKMNFNTFLEFVTAMQHGEHLFEALPQFRIQTDRKRKKLVSKECRKIFQTYCSDKRFFNPQLSLTEFFAYGVVPPAEVISS